MFQVPRITTSLTLLAIAGSMARSLDSFKRRVL